MQELLIRKNTRLKGYDYSQPGAYFVTICTKNMKHLFGTINNGIMHLSGCGQIANDELQKISSYYEHVLVDKYIVMPNHVHMIVEINSTERINPFPTVDIPNIIGKYKAGVSRIVGSAFMRSDIWQKSYHDHIIRTEKYYNHIAQYITENPMRWQEDCFYTK